MEIKKREKSNVIIFEIIGDFQKPTVDTDTLYPLVKDQLNEGRRNFLINLERADDIDDFGVGEMIACLISVVNLGGTLKFVPSKFWQERGWERGCHIRTYEDEDEAIKSFSE